MTVRIAPSLLAADFSRLAEEVRDAEAGGADLIHLDLMDGRFVPNLTFGPPVIKAIAPHASVPLDAHLMVMDPDILLEPLAAAGVARVAVHVETVRHLHRTLTRIRDLGMAAGITLNPATPLCWAVEALRWVDFVLVMSVNPGFGGQRFIPESVDRIATLRRQAGSDLDIAVDGGVGPDTAGVLAEAGASTLIAGSAVFGASDRARAIQTIRNHAAKGALA